jgi:hypothetical protein
MNKTRKINKKSRKNNHTRGRRRMKGGSGSIDASLIFWPIYEETEKGLGKLIRFEELLVPIMNLSPSDRVRYVDNFIKLNVDNKSLIQKGVVPLEHRLRGKTPEKGENKSDEVPVNKPNVSAPNPEPAAKASEDVANKAEEAKKAAADKAEADKAEEAKKAAADKAKNEEDAKKVEEDAKKAAVDKAKKVEEDAKKVEEEAKKKNVAAASTIVEGLLKNKNNAVAKRPSTRSTRKNTLETINEESEEDMKGGGNKKRGK